MVIIQAFLNSCGFDFRNFRFTAVYNSILFSSSLLLLLNLDLRGFCFCGFFFVSTHQQRKPRNACMYIQMRILLHNHMQDYV